MSEMPLSGASETPGRGQSAGRLERSLDGMTPGDQNVVLRSLVKSGMCVHSMFVADCNGCRERELTRALAALVDEHKHGFTTPTHGLVPSEKGDLWKHAEAILALVDRYGKDD